MWPEPIGMGHLVWARWAMEEGKGEWGREPSEGIVVNNLKLHITRIAYCLHNLPEAAT